MKSHKKRNKDRKYLSMNCIMCKFYFGKPRKRKCLSCPWFYPENDFQIPQKNENKLKE